MLFMGIDAGTQGVRAVVVDEAGALLASESIAFKTINSSAVPGRYEQRPADWISAAEGAIKGCVNGLARAGLGAEAIRAISVDGTSGTIVPLDKQYKPLCDAFMYNDMRSGAEAGAVRAVCGALEARMGLRFNASFSLPRVLWVKNRLSELYERTFVFAHQADYIVGMLSGEYRVSDYSNALKTGYDLIENEWPACFGALGLDETKFPKIVPPGAVIANVTRQAAAALGLSEKTVVVGGSTDGYASALAAGAVKPGDWASIVGTTLVLKGVTPSLVIDPTGSAYSHKLPSGAWMLGGASNIGGRCLNNRFDKAEFAALDASVAALTPSGALVYPLTGTGERFPFVDPDAKEFILGDTEDRRVLYAALMEGVGYVERLCYERMESLGCAVSGSVFTSGGACRSDEWLRIRASILNKPLLVPKIVDAAMGSAMLAASKEFGSLENAAKSMIRFEKRVEPVMEKAGRYNELYKRFLSECEKQYKF